MSDERNRKREAPLSIRLRKGQRQEIRRRADLAGLSVTAYVLKCIFDLEPPRQSRRPSIEKELVAEVISELAKTRAALEESAQSSGDESEADETFETACKDLTEIRAAAFTALGRVP